MSDDKQHTCVLTATTISTTPPPPCPACIEDDRQEAERYAEAKAKEDEENAKSVNLWHNLALLHGYDAIKRKQTTSFGERVFCELALQQVKKILLELGVEIKESPTGKTLTLPHRLPFIVFEAEDIESMRALVAEYDAKKTAPIPPATVE